MSQFIGARFPVHTTSTGKVLLAWQPEIAQYTNTPIHQYTPHTIQSIDRLQAELRQVKQQGFATTIDELEIGLSAVAAPIFNTHGEIHASLCIGGPSSRISEEKRPFLAQQVIKYAQHISEALGFKEEREETRVKKVNGG
jgi:DNA-binding IclR family transcriptional regulator